MSGVVGIQYEAFLDIGGFRCEGVGYMLHRFRIHVHLTKDLSIMCMLYGYL